ncbi:MAG: O-antigen ligase family protein [Burkholderiales bacterium]|nr:O-antigen ligase family protein [Burkholderiales bacterium]
MASHPVGVAALGFAAVIALGMLWSPIPLPQLRNAMADVVRFILLAVLLTLFADPKTQQRARVAFLATSAGVLALSFVLWSGIAESIPGLKGRPDYPVVFKYHITHNVLMAAAALLFALEAMKARMVQARLALWALALLAALNILLLIPGRTGQLALFAVSIYLLLSRLRWRGLGIAALGLALVASTAWFLPRTALHERAARAWEEASAWKPGTAQAQDSSVGLRLEFYRNTVGMIAERPLLGAGTGAFRAAYERKVAESGMVVTDHPHNAFLLIGAELGVVGLLALFALLIVQWRSAAAITDPRDRLAARGLVVIFIAAGLVSSTFNDHAEGLFFAWASALLFAAARTTDSS